MQAQERNPIHQTKPFKSDNSLNVVGNAQDGCFDTDTNWSDRVGLYDQVCHSRSFSMKIELQIFL